MTCTRVLRRVCLALWVMLTPACLMDRAARPTTQHPIPVPPPQIAAPAQTVEPPMPVLSFHPVGRLSDPTPVRVVQPTRRVGTVENTEEPSSEEGPPLVSKIHPVEPPLITSLRLYMDRNPDGAIEKLKVYDEPNQKFLLAIIPPMMRATEGSFATAEPQDLAAMIEQLQTAAGLLKAKAALRTETVCFCRRIVKYGVFDPLDQNHSFRPGEMAELYVELRNVVGEGHVKPSGERGFRTRFACEFALRDTDNKIVWGKDCDSEEFSRSLRHDVYLPFRFCVPSIPAGTYTLWVRIVDQSTNRAVKRAVEFRVTTIPTPAL